MCQGATGGAISLGAISETALERCLVLVIVACAATDVSRAG